MHCQKINGWAFDGWQPLQPEFIELKHTTNGCLTQQHVIGVGKFNYCLQVWSVDENRYCFLPRVRTIEYVIALTLYPAWEDDIESGYSTKKSAIFFGIFLLKWNESVSNFTVITLNHFSGYVRFHFFPHRNEFFERHSPQWNWNSIAEEKKKKEMETFFSDHSIWIFVGMMWWKRDNANVKYL